MEDWSDASTDLRMPEIWQKKKQGRIAYRLQREQGADTLTLDFWSRICGTRKLSVCVALGYLYMGANVYFSGEKVIPLVRFSGDT